MLFDAIKSAMYYGCIALELLLLFLWEIRIVVILNFAHSA